MKIASGMAVPLAMTNVTLPYTRSTGIRQPFYFPNYQEHNPSYEKKITNP
jgi:hypothetical protein